jgi:hypothetical protein
MQKYSPYGARSNLTKENCCSSKSGSDQLDKDVRTTNTKIQSGGHFGRLQRPFDIDRVVVHRVVVFSKIASTFFRNAVFPNGFLFADGLEQNPASKGRAMSGSG